MSMRAQDIRAALASASSAPAMGMEPLQQLDGDIRGQEEP